MVVLEFFDALNRGDRRALRFIAPDPEFNGWSVRERRTGEGVFVKAPNSKLFGYLRQRHEQGRATGAAGDRDWARAEHRHGALQRRARQGTRRCL
jgi:hypothetical protein